MNLKSKRTLTPNLRFPEFREEWQPATIGKVFKSDDKPVKATRFESDKILTVKLHTNGVVRNMRTDALTGGTNYFIRRAGQFIFSKIDLLNGAFGIVPMQYDVFYSSSDVPAFSFSTEHSPTFFLNWLTIDIDASILNGREPVRRSSACPPRDFGNSRSCSQPSPSNKRSPSVWVRWTG
jgi:type I restriction enzyme S subunit